MISFQVGEGLQQESLRSSGTAIPQRFAVLFGKKGTSVFFNDSSAPTDHILLRIIDLLKEWVAILQGFDVENGLIFGMSLLLLLLCSFVVVWVAGLVCL